MLVSSKTSLVHLTFTQAVVKVVDARFKHSEAVVCLFVITHAAVYHHSFQPPFPTSTPETAVREVTTAKPTAWDPKYVKPV